MVKGREWGSELKKGSIQICILALLSSKRMYGFEIVKSLRTMTKGYLDLKEGTLYPALHRLEKRGYLKSEWVIEGNAKPRRYYALTPEGNEALKALTREWKVLVEGVNAILKEVESVDE